MQNLFASKDPNAILRSILGNTLRAGAMRAVMLLAAFAFVGALIAFIVL